MVINLKKIAGIAFLLGLFYQSTAQALTDYVATGSFFGDFLEVIQFDEFSGDETIIDAFINSQPFSIPTSTFTLSFTVDDSFRGRVPLFSQASFFDGAISNVSIDINGANIFSSTTELATVSQFPGDFGGTLSANWGWSQFPEFEPFALPTLDVFDNNTFEPLGTIDAQGFSFRLFDSTRQLYNGGSFLDMLSLDLADFDATSFQLFWANDFDEEPEFGDEPPEINYTVFASIDTLTNVSVIPLPGGIWLLLSGITGFLVATRRTRDA
ncbi:MAG: VPLPA-CTERM sorting domain-containing protein [Pseudomonadota bacterium]